MDLLNRLEQSGLAQWMRESLYALPLINSFHVVGLALVFGTVLVVDLRLLGFPSTRRSFRQISRETLRWTWVGFALAAVTGALMFSANPTTFVNNNEFLIKLGLIVLAGLNMLYFQLVTFRTVEQWDRNAPVPLAGRLAGAASMTLWLAVIVFGRWIGYTKGFDFTVPEDMDFDDLFSLVGALTLR